MDDTTEVLDWQSVLDALATHARTPMGREAAATLAPLASLHDVQRTMDAIDEVRAIEDGGTWIPVGAVDDVIDEVRRAQKGSVLDVPELRAIGLTLQGLSDLYQHLTGTEVSVTVLPDIAQSLVVDPLALDHLRDAFDDTGELSSRTYPALADLRERIQSLHSTIRSTLDDLVHGESLGDALQDRYVTQRSERYVLPIKSNFKRKELGIVHGTSSSGQTAFIEPHQVIALNNQLRIAEGELDAEIRRILTLLSSAVARVAPQILVALDAATWIDLACARAAFADAIDAIRPHVGQQGVISLKRARHPVLMLRGVTVVPNDLELSADCPVLVVSGPNTGGKTIVLKTFGLCALLVQIGCFVPAAEGSRVDRFEHVTAIIGDHQTVHGDQSSFSSHVLALKHMLDTAGPDQLYLIDEIASGTDPQQGSALAHAVLEALLDNGPRVVTTTHFARLKTLSTVDPRFSIAALQFRNGRPTYRLLHGASGESHALEVAERVGISTSILERSRDLLGAAAHDLSTALKALDAERERASTAAEQIEQERRELAEQHARLEAKEARIREKAEQLQAEGAERFLDRLRRAEQAVKKVVADLQRNPSHTGVNTARTVIESLHHLAPKAEPDEAPARAPAGLAVGDRVRLRKLGQTGHVVAIKGKQVQIDTGRLTVRAAPEDLERLAPQRSKPTARPRRSQQAQRAQAPSGGASRLAEAMRHPGNSLDLRGKRVDEALDAVEAFLDTATMRQQDTVFILHGHGTGAVKEAVRRWLPGSHYVQRWAPANADQGGDAYTVVLLR